MESLGQSTIEKQFSLPLAFHINQRDISRWLQPDIGTIQDMNDQDLVLFPFKLLQPGLASPRIEEVAQKHHQPVARKEEGERFNRSLQVCFPMAGEIPKKSKQGEDLFLTPP